MRLIRQPEGTALCGQCCVAMAAGVSLERAIEAVGHRKQRGTTTGELVRALRFFGVECADCLRRVSRSKPIGPRRGLVVIKRDDAEHWMLTWDGEIKDPGDRWPEAYANWKITSYLEIL